MFETHSHSFWSVQVFHEQLLALRLDTCRGAINALERLKDLDSDAAKELQNSFEVAKQRVSLRFRQAASYLTEFPWNLCRVLSPFFRPMSEEVDEHRFMESKDWAKQLIQQYDTGLRHTCGEFARFLDPSASLGRSMRQWATSDDTRMEPELLHELVAYSSSLVSMQRLESKHHLVSQRMGIARNSTPATLSANLRRSLNSDVMPTDFKTHFGRYLLEFSKLVDSPWQPRTELAKLICGYHLDVMFKDMSTNQEIIQSQFAPNRTDKNTLELLNHLKSVLEEGSFYALPVELFADGSTKYLIVQLVTFTPSSKKYMQKILKWSNDPWFEKLGVVVMGHTTVTGQDQIIDCDQPLRPLPSPADFSFATVTSCPSEIPVDCFFKMKFDCIYVLADVDYNTVLSPSIRETLDSTDAGSVTHSDLMYRVRLTLLCDINVSRIWKSTWFTTMPLALLAQAKGCGAWDMCCCIRH